VSASTRRPGHHARHALAHVTAAHDQQAFAAKAGRPGAERGFGLKAKSGAVSRANRPEDTQRMTFQITVQPSGRSFTANPDEAILPAAIRQGIGLPYGCKDGACGSCKCKKLEGTVVHGPHQTRH
jgi:ferredoxin